jgi:hypothetical protein
MTSRAVVMVASCGLILSCAGGTGENPPPGGQQNIGNEPVGTISLPFRISDEFSPTGYMGDGEQVGPLTSNDGDTSKCMERPAGVAGQCYRFDYKPGSRLWAGVYWQFPANNWGAYPGKVIAAGATKVTFWAAASKKEAKIKVRIGGIKDATLPHQDTLAVEKELVITDTMKQYTVELGGKGYEGGVLGAFAWTYGSAPEDSAGVQLYFDGLEWSK